jgi:hypothetical protein
MLRLSFFSRASKPEFSSEPEALRIDEMHRQAVVQANSTVEAESEVLD